jgi:NADPH-dependent curcumin reductase CurA
MSEPTATKGREIRLASRPSGWPTPDNFELAEVDVPEPADGQVLVRNVVMSVDPYMRGRMDDVKSYVPPFQIGHALDGGAVGEVVASRAPGFSEGDLVLHNFGWRDYALVTAKYATRVDPDVAPPSAYLGVLGMPGLTAYAGLLEVGQFHEGDTVFVSGAAGAVGSVVGQIAKLRGAKRVVGSAGSAEKVRWLTEELGFDAAFNYKDGPVRDQLFAAAPDGIDVYFDNVGGDHLEAALAALTLHGRIAVCGMISAYNASEPPAAPRNLAQVIKKRLTIRGFLVSDHADLLEQFASEVGAWVRDGKVRYQETVVEGLENAPEAFLDMLRGKNTGKMVVAV